MFSKKYGGAIPCNSVRTAMALDNVIPILAHDPGHRFDGPFTVATDSARLLTALVAQDELEYEGIIYRCGMQPGVADFSNWGVRGYVWPYMRFGQSDGDPSIFWFVLRGYSGSFEKVEFMNEFLREHQAATWRLVRDDLDEGSQLILMEPACNGIDARIPWCADPRGSKMVSTNREINARYFALAGHLDPDNIEVLISAAPCPDPLSWDYP